MVGAMDPYWGSLHCVRILIVSLVAQMYKWVLVTGQGWQGAAEVTSITALLIFFFLTLVPNALEPSKTPLKGP